MKKLVTKLVVSISGLLLLLGTTVAMAASLKVGVVDLPHILQQSKQVKAINKNLQEQFKPQQQKIVAIQQQIRDQAKKLAPSASKKLSASERKSVQAKIASEQKELQKQVLEFQQNVSAAQGKAMKQFMHKINMTVKKIAKKQKIELVLLKPAVVYASNTIDLTKQVLAAMPKS